ncbi:MAG: LacI family DNA-binding transcriptional regulator, partial [Bifidobacteriaceae bacterium]|nr:LacI family DNA-binding transcriptional regulator [Bifidobacteriaceae bacterium]
MKKKSAVDFNVESQPTINDVAHAAGVSTFTVSRALSNRSGVSEKTRAKVLKVAKELNYTISKSASSLASGKTMRVALLARATFAGWFMGELFNGLYDILHPQNYDLVLYRIANSEERKNFFNTMPAKRNADALIVTG